MPLYHLRFYVRASGGAGGGQHADSVTFEASDEAEALGMGRRQLGERTGVDFGAIFDGEGRQLWSGNARRP